MVHAFNDHKVISTPAQSVALTGSLLSNTLSAPSVNIHALEYLKLPASAVDNPGLESQPTASINDLPDELLILIFRVFYLTGPRKTLISGNAQCLLLMKTCRRWHDLVVNHGFFWSFVNICLSSRTSWPPWIPSERQRIRAQTQRAGLWPLHVCHTSSDSHIWSMDSVWQNTPPQNLKSLHIHGLPLTDIIIILRKDTSRRLESLLLGCREAQHDDPLPQLPDDILALPKLRRLTIWDLDIPMRTIPCTLTELSIRAGADAGHSYDFHEFLDVVAHLPLLETLDEQFLFFQFVGSLKSIPLIYLPRLRILRISDRQEILNVFLTRLTSSPLSHPLHLKFESYTPIIYADVAYFSDQILTPIRELLRSRGTVPRLRALELRPARGSLFKFTTLRCFSTTNLDRISENLGMYDDVGFAEDEVELDFVFGVDGNQMERRVYRRVFRHLMPDVELLCLHYPGHASGLPPRHVAWWKDALLSLVSLKVIYVAVDVAGCDTICLALQQIIARRPKNFLRLDALYLCKRTKADLEEAALGWYDEGKVAPEHANRNAEALLALASAYKDAGHAGFSMGMTFNSDFDYWPGKEETTALKEVLKDFYYIETTRTRF